MKYFHVDLRLLEEVRRPGPAFRRPLQASGGLPGGLPDLGRERRDRRLQDPKLGLLFGVKGHSGRPVWTHQQASVRLLELWTNSQQRHCNVREAPERTLKRDV